MASIEQKDIPIESRFMTDFWQFRKKFWCGEGNETFWAELVDAANGLAEKYKSPYTEALILACVGDIENRYNELSGKERKIDIVDTIYKHLKGK